MKRTAIAAAQHSTLVLASCGGGDDGGDTAGTEARRPTPRTNDRHRHTTAPDETTAPDDTTATDDTFGAARHHGHGPDARSARRPVAQGHLRRARHRREPRRSPVFEQVFQRSERAVAQHRGERTDEVSEELALIVGNYEQLAGVLEDVAFDFEALFSDETAAEFWRRWTPTRVGRHRRAGRLHAGGVRLHGRRREQPTTPPLPATIERHAARQ